MKLLPLDTDEAIALVAGWLGKYDNYKWLDFGNGVQQLTPVMLKIMTQRGLHEFRIYTADEGDVPAGVVGLSNVDRHFKNASLWAVLGNKRCGGYTLPACSAMLTYGFSELGLEMINAWTLETNIPAQRVLEGLHFRYAGRLRHCHYMDGRPLDRLLFDLLPTEHQDQSQVRRQRARASDLGPVR